MTECLKYKYPYYDGMDKEIYESFLVFLINKYEKIRSYLPDDSDRIPVIKKELEVMNMAYKDYLINTGETDNESQRDL
jgi:hypothetical protein